MASGLTVMPVAMSAKMRSVSTTVSTVSPAAINPTLYGLLDRWGFNGHVTSDCSAIADLSRTLREEELQAWQRIVRVLGHELNNSLAPIKSIAGSLTTMLRRPERPADWLSDMLGGLEIIEARAEGLNRFMQSYARLAKLPAPNKQPCEIGPLLRRVVLLETRTEVPGIAPII